MEAKILNQRLNHLNSKASITKLARDFDASGNDFKLLIKIIINNEAECIDRASWLAREYANIKPEIATKYYSKIIEIVSSNCSDSVKRNLTGLLVDIGIPERYQSKVLDLSINILLDLKLAVAVHANALKLIKMLIKVHPDIKHEIDLITERHPYRNRVSFFCNL